MLEARFARSNFEATADPRPLCLALALRLTACLRSAMEPEAEALKLVGELRRLGHDLYCYDHSGDWQIWVDDWHTVRSPFELLVEFRHPEDEPREAWSVSVQFGRRSLAP